MPSLLPSGTAAVAAVLLAAAVLSGCSDADQPTPAAGGSSASRSAPASSSAQASSSATAANVPGPTKTRSATAARLDVAIDVQIVKGKVTSNQPIARAHTGDRILLRVVSDATDEVHVHGVDKTMRLAAGVPGSLIFVVTQTGTFEIETHTSKKVLAKLVVS